LSKEEKNKKKSKEKKKKTLLQRIVNGFLYAGLGLLILILILLGITQTSTFREYLRETVIEQANSALNGKLYIEEIDGTIFTSLLLRNTVITMEEDTLLKAEKIGVLTSPLQLLLKKIHVRHFEIQNANINLKTDKSGELNFAKLFPPSEEPDTAQSQFPFVIQIANLEFENVNLSLKDYTVEKSSTYDQLNFNDLQVKNFNLNLDAKLNINENIYEMNLDHLSFSTNVEGLSINELEADFFINENKVIAQDIHIKTERSSAMINIAADDLNLFDTTGINPEKANLNLQAGSEGFSFQDLKAITPSLDMLKGNIKFGLDASGTTENLNLKNIRVSLDNSKIEGEGELKNLMGDNLLIDVDLSGSYINQNDIKNLLAGTEVPVYPELGIIRFDTLIYTGSPSDFKSRLNILTDKGNVAGLINLNLENELLQYDVDLSTHRIDIEPFAGVKSDLNISADFKGMGTSPETFDGSVRIYTTGSSVNGNKIDTLRLTADANNQYIEYDFRVRSNETMANLNGYFDFAPEEPVYNVNGEIRDLNIAEFVPDTTLESNINLSLDAEGDGFTQDNLDLFLNATLHNSNLSNVKIDTTRLIVDLRSDPGNRVINIISDLADITIMGDYKVAQAVDLIVSEMSLVSTAFSEKMNSIFPSVVEEENETKAGLKIKEPLFVQVDEPVSFNYLIDLKDFSLVSAFIGNYNLDVDAEMGGRFESTADDSVLFTFNTDLGYVKFYNDTVAYFISNLLIDLEVQNSFNAQSTSDLLVDMNVTADRVLAGSEIFNLDFDFEMQDNVAEFSLSANPEPYTAKIISEIDLSGSSLEMSIDSLKLLYGKFEIQNRDNLILSYNGNRLDIDQFALFHDNSEINIEGYLSQSGNQQLEINLHNWRAKDLTANFMNTRPENSVEASINFGANITGSFESPVISAVLLIDSIAFGNKRFGKLKSIFNYNDKNFVINLAFLDSALNNNDTALTLKGNIPVDLAFSGAEENYMESKPMTINLHSDGFNLGAFGDVLPAVNRLRGNFTSDLEITGTPSSLTTNGFIKVVDAAFFLEANNLEYNASLLVNINDENLKLDSLVIANVKGTENGGRMHGSGSAKLDNFELTESKFSFNGDLKVLGEASKPASSSIYGELVIGTEGNVEVDINNEGIFLKAPIVIKNADVTFPQSQSAYQSGSQNYIYKFAVDTTTMADTSRELGFEELVEISEQSGKKEGETAAPKNIFDYNISVRIQDEATITFVLSREFNQNLVAVLEGKLDLIKEGSKTKIDGKLELLEGSTLQFIKTLEAVGSIDFRSGEISNPYLDITAIYFNYYYPGEGASDAGEEIPVEVRLFIEGPLEDLSKRLVSGEENIKVYYGRENIEDDNPTPRYDASDAVTFLLLDRFFDGSNPQDRDLIASTAAGLAGSVVGGFLNQQFGDVIKSVELRQTEGATVVSLVGRAGKFRYEIGTSTDVYQDLSRANVKIQYPVTKSLFLRVERKESINRESTYTNEMVNEVGIKYLFEF
jgi:hypothetical protein